MRAVVFLDCETNRSAQECIHCGMQEGYCRAEGHTYTVIGWNDKETLGISIGGCLYEETGIVTWFDPMNITARMYRIIDDSERLVTFNGRKFDIPLMCAVAGVESEISHLFAAYCADPANHCDLLDVIWRTDPHRKRMYGINSLDALCQANGLGKKTGDGAYAPVLWRKGFVADVLNYCQHDLFLTQKLYEYIFMNELRRNGVQNIIVPAPWGEEYLALYAEGKGK